jgi:hypothetical protein
MKTSDLLLTPTDIAKLVTNEYMRIPAELTPPLVNLQIKSANSASLKTAKAIRDFLKRNGAFTEAGNVHLVPVFAIHHLAWEEFEMLIKELENENDKRGNENAR